MKNLTLLPIKMLMWSVINLPLLLGMIYVLFILVAGSIFVFGMATSVSTPLAWDILRYGWKIYVGFVVATFLMMTTFTYQNCCVGINSFYGHNLHAKKRHLENFMIAILWPFMWYAVDRNLKDWTLSWADVVFGAFKYWFAIRWRGVQVESLDLRSGNIKTTYVGHDGK